MVELLSNSSLHQSNTYKTYLIHLKLFVQTGVIILSACAKFCHVRVTRMQEKIPGAGSMSEE